MKVSIIGAGSWGTALANVLAGNGHEVLVFGRDEDVVDKINQEHMNFRYLPGIKLHPSIRSTLDLQKAMTTAKLLVISIPSRSLPDLFSNVSYSIPSDTILVHTVKGLVRPGNLRVSQFFATQPKVANLKLGVLSGPSHAEEVVRQLPTTVVVASASKATAEFIQDAFMSPCFRVYGQSDVIGVELGGTLKNIIALGVGLTEGLGLGDNAKAALMTRGLAEISRLGIALGASPLTFSGLSGVGDLIVTCTSSHSRNYRAGRLLAQGLALDDVLNTIGMVVEGVGTTYAAHDVAETNGIDMPITSALRKVLESTIEPIAAVRSLMERKKNHEMEDVGEHVLRQYWAKQ